MTTVRAAATVGLAPAAALALWLDTRRWPTFVEGFGSVTHTVGDWPAEGGVLTWQSTPNGRGRVIETVTARGAAEVVSAVEEERLRGVQTARFAPAGDGTAVAVAFAYRLRRSNPVLDLLFVRRAQRDALWRTVERFAREAESDARTGA